MRLYDTITIYRKSGSTYNKQIINNVYWYGSSNNVESGHGKQISYTFRVECLDTSIDVELNDIVLKGIGNDIDSIAQLPQKDLFTISGIDRHIANSKLDYISFYGK